MYDIDRASIELVEESPDGRYGKFEVKRLKRGFGNTLGNAMRRVLLSSIPGTAVSFVKIDGILHELSAIPGVKEDVTEVILNIKKLCLKLHGEGPKVITIDAEGECQLCAGDIITDSDVEIVDKEMHIATLNEDAKLYMEITINNGYGYVTSEKNKLTLGTGVAQQIGLIPVDSIYSPITKVKYEVEAMRVDQNIDREKLTLEIWSNGTVTPDDAISRAARTLCDELSIFMNLKDQPYIPDSKSDKDDGRKEKVLEMTIEDLDLSVRSYNCLKRAGINTVEDLIGRTEEDMMKVRNLGRKSFEEVRVKLNALGVNLNIEEDS